MLGFTAGIALVTILLFGGYSRDISYGLQTGYILRGGHLQVQRQDYFLYGSGNPAAYGIGDYQRVIEDLRRKMEQIEDVFPRPKVAPEAPATPENVSK